MTQTVQSNWIESVSPQYADINGLNIRYIKVGQGEPLVLVHTIRTQLDYFQKVIPTLAQHFEVYALDMPGFGHSDIPAQEITSDFLIHSVESFLLSLNLSNITLAGESIGGAIVLALGANGKLPVKRIVSLNPYDYGQNNDGIKRSSLIGNIVFTGLELPVIGWVVAHAENKIVLQKILEGGLHDPKALPQDLLNEFNRVGFRKGYRRSERSSILNLNSWTRVREQYSKIGIPVTLVYGESDWSLSSEREDNQKTIPGCEFIILNDCGHFSCLDSPEQIINILRNK